MGKAHKPHPNKYTAFLSKVDTHGLDPSRCWEWLGATKGNGYGNVRVAGANVSAHRWAYQLFVGFVGPGMDVCHSCDNPICVNPDHLFAGTRADNMHDAKMKGRTRGGRPYHLKPRQVQAIVNRIKGGLSSRQIANDLGINYGTVTAIRAGRSYSHITGFGEKNGG
tara:strand:- start:2394 stop:2891 length:498 start_codon:yes stop_codon:yes gene_type:complete